MRNDVDSVSDYNSNDYEDNEDNNKSNDSHNIGSSGCSSSSINIGVHEDEYNSTAINILEVIRSNTCIWMLLRSRRMTG